MCVYSYRKEEEQKVQASAWYHITANFQALLSSDGIWVCVKMAVFNT